MVEGAHDLAVTDRTVLIYLPEFHQLFPRVVKLFIRGQEGHDGTHVKVSLNGIVTTDEKEDERPEAHEEIIDELDAEFDAVLCHCCFVKLVNDSGEARFFQRN